MQKTKIRFYSPKKDIATLFLLGRVRRVYNEWGARIIDALEQSSGLAFSSGINVRVQMSENTMWEGDAGKVGREAVHIDLPKNLASQEDADGLIIWLLIHELGHRLCEQHGLWFRYHDNDLPGWTEAEHRLLFLFLVDALYLLGERGELVIKNWIEFGYPRSDMSYPHTKAWVWAFDMNSNKRQDIWQKFLVTRDYSLVSDYADVASAALSSRS